MYSINTKEFIDKAIRFARIQGVILNLDDPKTIQDKLSWLNIYDVNDLKVKCADKIKIHDYCKDVLGEDLCIPIIAIYDKVEDIKWNELPEKFVIKCNHGSGMNIIVQDKNSIDIEFISNKINTWMNVNFAFQNGFESHYNDIPHKIFVEKYMEDGHDGSLYDYKFWCFNGEPKLYTINGGNGHGDIMYYKMDGTEWNLYDVPQHDDYKKPKNFAKMKKLAKKLAEPFKFVRVDLYEIDDKIYLGEMTFTPGACVFKYKDPANNIEVGKMLKI